MFVGLVIAMTASLGTYFFYPPVKSVQAQSKCATFEGVMFLAEKHNYVHAAAVGERSIILKELRALAKKH